MILKMESWIEVLQSQENKAQPSLQLACMCREVRPQQPSRLNSVKNQVVKVFKVSAFES